MSLSPINYNICIEVLIKRHVSSYILQGPLCMAIKLQGDDTMLTFGGSHLLVVLIGHLGTFLGLEMKD